MTDFNTLRPEVRSAIHDLAIAATLRPQYQQPVGIVRAELLRLAERNAALESKATRDFEWNTELLAANKQAETELAALKARMKPCARVVGGEVRVFMDSAHEGKYVAVLVVEENEPTGEHADSMEAWAERKVGE